jgi:hypothetical protein
MTIAQKAIMIHYSAILRIVVLYLSFPLALFIFPKGTLFNRAGRESILGFLKPMDTPINQDK